MKWGVIGTGNMGEILIDSWMTSQVIMEDELFITNRTISKAYDIQERYPGVNVCPELEQLIECVDIIYICVKPLEIYPLLNNLYSSLRSDQCIVSITSPYSVERLEQFVPCQVARMIPSITNRAVAGVTLATFGNSISKEMRGYLLQSSRIYSTPEIIEDNVTRISSDIVSCGPAFFGFLAEQYITAASEETHINKEVATKLTEKMFIGFGKLLEDGYYTLPELIEKVCVKGGVTGEGIKAMESNLGELFTYLIAATHDKYNEDIAKISKQILDE
ncbi:late competence protein ComER [Aquibacillus rhizosphaerae]|uniref:Late competence protein ComER n=1 Tax=Aquibacillus rhizosphaerae TaxID=3051431 RepID=A0ABT7LAB0_9BACI|nr:late competence protein ComER [Aquibacillus sp. LR5S19]MDL4841476.1 late competence protein ComER [Aquibacillus sp. LR5S19]